MPCVGLRIGIVPPNRSCLPKWGSRLNRGCQLQGSSPPPESLSWRRFPQTRPNRGSHLNLRSQLPKLSTNQKQRGMFSAKSNQVPNMDSSSNLCCKLNRGCQLQGSSPPPESLSWRRFPRTRPNQCNRPSRDSRPNRGSRPNLCCQLQKLGTNQKQRGIFSAKSNRVPNMGSPPNLCRKPNL